ncbi:unnamed protein product [Cyprideis torosa]|uniref:Uncharacterized protein n=1 Tax=Cyprideis torosa TaxID=163714 RepID=A0A7R8ZJ68_9CRUS|nr:unnamed protein product [Cyprideis torosa]CAG0879220.1 unnamed protein product [Cyprideis torosa]
MQGSYLLSAAILISLYHDGACGSSSSYGMQDLISLVINQFVRPQSDVRPTLSTKCPQFFSQVGHKCYAFHQTKRLNWSNAIATCQQLSSFGRKVRLVELTESRELFNKFMDFEFNECRSISEKESPAIWTGGYLKDMRIHRVSDDEEISNDPVKAAIVYDHCNKREGLRSLDDPNTLHAIVCETEAKHRHDDDHKQNIPLIQIIGKRLPQKIQQPSLNSNQISQNPQSFSGQVPSLQPAINSNRMNGQQQQLTRSVISDFLFPQLVSSSAGNLHGNSKTQQLLDESPQQKL